MVRRKSRGPGLEPRSSLIGLIGGHTEGMSATAYQRKRRELQEQTSVSARMNEEGSGDPYAKTLKNYDEVGIKDTGEEHQAGDPPPTSETGHVPEKLAAAQRVETVEDEDGLRVVPPDEDVGTVQQAGDPPLTSVELREGEEPGEGEPFEDQAKYNALDKREFASAEASEANVNLPSGSEGEEPIGDVIGRGEYVGSNTDNGGAIDGDNLQDQSVAELRDIAKDEGVEGYSTMRKAELIEAIRSQRS